MNKRLSILPFLVATACSTALPSIGQPDAATPVTDTATGVCPSGFPLEEIGYKWTTQVMVDGAGPYHFIVDTGAPTSLLDKKVAASGTHVLSAIGQERELALSSAALSDYGIMGDGFLGADFFGDQVLTFDPKRKLLWLSSTLDETSLAACEHAEAKGSTVDFELQSYISVQGQLEGQAARLLIDTGATFGAIDENVFAALNAAAPRPTLGGFYTPAGAGTFWASLTTIGSIAIGDQSVARILARTADGDILNSNTVYDDVAALVPLGFFRHFLMSVDYPNHRLRLAPYRGDTMVEPAQRYVAGIGLSESLAPPIVVTEVLANSSAADEGVAVGDEIVAIDGKAIGTIPPTSRGWALTSPTASRKVTVVVTRDGEKLTKSLVTRDLMFGPM